MAEGLVSDTNLTAIANAIRTKNGSSDTYTPAEMATAITNIPTSQVDQTTALQWMLNNKTNYTGIAAGLTSLTTLPAFTQPSGIYEFIGAFSRCSSLTSISGLDLTTGDLSSFHDMFYGCSNLQSDIEIIGRSDSVSGGGSRVCYGCPKIRSFIFKTTAYPYGSWTSAFEGCSMLSTVKISNTATTDTGNTVYQVQSSRTSSVAEYKNYDVDVSKMFRNCTALPTIDKIRIGTSSQPIFSASNMFEGCSSLTSIVATSSNTIFALDMSAAFRYCSSLTDVSRYIISSKCMTCKNAFSGCSALSDLSLNNIMSALAAATSYTGTKTLKDIGLSSTQATTCTGLSNWTALSAAGWTTGY